MVAPLSPTSVLGRDRLAAGEIETPVERDLAGVALLREFRGECRFALHIGATDSGQRRKIGQGGLDRRRDIAAGLCGAVQRDQRMGDGESDRPLRCVEDRLGLHRNRRRRQKIGLRPRQMHLIERAGEIDLAAVALKIGRDAADAGTVCR